MNSSMSTHPVSGPDKDPYVDLARAASELGGQEHAGEVLLEVTGRASTLTGAVEVTPASDRTIRGGFTRMADGIIGNYGDGEGLDPHSSYLPDGHVPGVGFRRGFHPPITASPEPEAIEQIANEQDQGE